MPCPTRGHGDSDGRRLRRRARIWLPALAGTISLAAAIPAQSATLLHDQYDRFEAGWSADHAAPSFSGAGGGAVAYDDFVVPEGQRWTIQRLDVRGLSSDGMPFTGVYGIGVSRSVTNSTTGGPGADDVASTAATPTFGPTDKDLRFVVDLRAGPGSAPVPLAPGRYWLHVVAGTPIYEPPEPWLWADRRTASGLPAGWTAWASGPIGFWVPERCVKGIMGFRATDCHLDPSHPDQVFRLWGTVSRN